MSDYQKKFANSLRENVVLAIRYGHTYALNALENVAIDIADILDGQPSPFNRAEFMEACGLDADL